jgi:hypothetical protein
MSAYIRTQGLPTSIPGCQLWFDAADRSSMTFSGSTVTQWNDKSGNARNATNGADPAPTYSANGFNGGYPGLLFNGSTRMSTPAIIPQPVLSANGTDTSIFLVFNYNFTGVNYAVYGLGSVDNTYVLRTPWTTGTYGTAIIDTTATLASPGRITFTFGSAQAAGQLYSILRSGALHSFYQYGSLTTSVSPQSGTVGTTSQTFNIGGANGTTGASLFFNSYISELIIYNVALTTAQQQQVESYLAWKWGLQASLPSTNPYSAFNYFNSSITLSLTNPLQLPGLIAWFDAADTTTYTPGATITSWRNKGSAGGNATSSSGVSSTSSNINGLPAMTFAVGAVMTVPSLTYLDASKSMFAVVTIGALGTTNGIFTDSVSASNWPVFNQGVGYLGYGTFLNNVFQVPPGSTFGFFNSTSVLTGHDYLISGTTYGGGIYINGFPQPLTTNAPRAFTTGTRTSFVLGSSGSTAIKVMGEILVYDSSLTPYQRQQVETYLMYKWKVYPGVTPSPIAQTILSNRTTGGFTFATFNPLSISGLILWLDAADNTTITGTSAAVTAWRDKSGNANNATATGTITLANNINGVQSMVMSRAAAFFRGAISITTPGVTCFAVATTTLALPNNSSSDQRLVSVTAGTNLDYTNPQSAILLFNQQLTNSIQTFRNGGGVVANTMVQNVPFLVATQLDSTNSLGSMWFNGSFTGSGGTINSNFAVTAYGIANDAANQTGEYWQGYIGEVIMFNTILTTVQRQNVEGYLGWKWGLQGSLPSRHPNALAPPPP